MRDAKSAGAGAADISPRVRACPKTDKGDCVLNRAAHAGRDVSPLLFIYHARVELTKWAGLAAGVCVVFSSLSLGARSPIIFKQKGV